MKINERALAHFSLSKPWVDREGWLWKKGELNTSYQKRWCVLQGNLLFYFEKRSEKDPMGVIVLEQCTVQLAEGGDSPYTFSIKFPGSGLRTYKLMADDEETCNNWIKSLSLSSRRYLKILVDELQRDKQVVSQTSNLLQLPANMSMKIVQSNGERRQQTRTYRQQNTENDNKKLLQVFKSDIKPVKTIDDNREGIKSKTVIHKSVTNDQTLLKVEYSGKTKLRNRLYLTANAPRNWTSVSIFRPFSVLHELYRQSIESSNDENGSDDENAEYISLPPMAS